MDPVGQIIVKLGTLSKDDPIYRRVPNMTTLILALKELQSLVGMTKAKESVVDQVRFLMVNSREDLKQHVLHTVLYGPPGVGKTSLGVVLTKIWMALGLLEQPTRKENETNTKPCTNEFHTELIGRNVRLLCEQRNLFEANVKLKLALDASKIHIRKSREYIRLGMSKIRRVIPPRIRYRKRWYKSTSVIRKAQDHIQQAQQIVDLPTLMYDERFNDNITVREIDNPEVPDKVVDTPIKIVSRADFVAKYVGQTAIKTNKLLESAVGGVLFIDEAYSLINGERDSFGSEAVTTLTKFMSERPHDIIIIFAGYKQKMQETIFAEQPGLQRRCAWTFEVEGYTPKELSEIFKIQAAHDKWSVDPTVNLGEFFTKNKDTFKNYGGDTQKLLFYCKLERAKIDFDRVQTVENDPLQMILDITLGETHTRRRPLHTTKTITEEILQSAVKRLQSNNTCDSSNDTSPEGLYM